jgi:hypothetical protein
MFAVGQLSEPVTRQLEWRRKPVEKVIVTANIVVPATILAVSYR